MDLRLLVLAPFYRWFVKDLLDAESKYLDEIILLVHHNKLVEIVKYLPFSGYFDWVRLFSRDVLLDLIRKPENLKINLISNLYFIPDGKNRRLGDSLFKIFDKHIQKNELEFDLIHAHFTWPQGYISYRLAQKYKVPYVITLHENDTHLRFTLDFREEIALKTWKNSDALIRVNKRDLNLFIQKGVSKVYYIPNGFNSDRLFPIPRYYTREYLGLERDVTILLNISTLRKEKGHRYLIEAMKLLKKDFPDIKCLIGGDGPLKSKLKRLIKKLNLQENVRLLGYISTDLVNYYMNAADIFVLPSLSEGNPTVMFEALGVGLPFVGTAVGGVPEIITSEDYGLLCKPGNAEDLAEKILIALEKEWDREKIRKYAEQFTWDNIAKQVVRVYEEVLNEH